MKDGASDQGFSLAEMLVVLAIISMVGFVGYNGFLRKGAADSINTVTKKVQHLAALTAMRAVSSGATQNLVIDLSNGILANEQTATSIQIPATFKLSTLTGAELVRQDKTASINFYSDGTSTGGEIILEDPRGSKGIVTILWLTGSIEMKVKGAP
jgi:general secretion pathway protein H